MIWVWEIMGTFWLFWKFIFILQGAVVVAYHWFALIIHILLYFRKKSSLWIIIKLFVLQLFICFLLYFIFFNYFYHFLWIEIYSSSISFYYFFLKFILIAAWRLFIFWWRTSFFLLFQRIASFCLFLCILNMSSLIWINKSKD